MNKIPGDTISAYCKIVEVDESIFKKELQAECIVVVCDGESFLTYEIHPNCILVRDLFGKGDWCRNEISKACKTNRKTRAQGFIKKGMEYLLDKPCYSGAKIVGHLINLEVKL